MLWNGSRNRSKCGSSLEALSHQTSRPAHLTPLNGVYLHPSSTGLTATLMRTLPITGLYSTPPSAATSAMPHGALVGVPPLQVNRSALSMLVTTRRSSLMHTGTSTMSEFTNPSLLLQQPPLRAQPPRPALLLQRLQAHCWRPRPRLRTTLPRHPPRRRCRVPPLQRPLALQQPPSPMTRLEVPQPRPHRRHSRPRKM